MTTLGASLIGSGEQLLVLDLSEADAAALLWQATVLHEIQGRKVILPHDEELFDVFAGANAVAIKDMLVEALHAGEDEADRRQRSLDDRILGTVCGALGMNVTLERIDLALGTVLRQVNPPTDHDGPLSRDEWDRLSQLFNEDYRRAVTDRLVDLEAAIHPLRLLGRKAHGAPQEGSASQWDCISLSRGGSTLHNELLVDLLVQKVIRQLRSAGRGTNDHSAVMVVGADALKRRHLEKLDELASSQGIRMVYLFRHLRDAGLEVAGSGQAAVAFMRLGNHREAEQAADFIGRAYTFVLSQRTSSTGTNRTITWSDTESRARTQTDGTSTSFAHSQSGFLGLFDHTDRTDSRSGGRSVTDSTGRTDGVSEGVSAQQGTTEQRVFEHAIEPEALRLLPPTALLLVEFSAATNGRRVVAADCDPRIAALPGVSRQSFAMLS